MRSKHSTTLATTLLMALALLFGQEAHAQARGGGGRGGVPARSSVHTAQSGRNANINSNRNVNSNTNVNRNVNVNSNVNVNRNVGYHGGGYRYDSWGHPVAAGAAMAAGAIAVGAVVASLPPQCSTVMMGAVTYQNCGGTYYQPRYEGTTVQYVVVNPP
jgi:hypothetical protein